MKNKVIINQRVKNRERLAQLLEEMPVELRDDKREYPEVELVDIHRFYGIRTYHMRVDELDHIEVTDSNSCRLLRTPLKAF